MGAAADERADFNFELEAFNDADEELEVRAIHDEERREIEKRLLFYVQGVGGIKRVGD